MPRGGRRSGKPGAAYGNRSDLNQAPRAAGTGTYGEAAAMKRAQEVVPLPKQPPVASMPPPVPGAQPFTRPTERPGEPVSAGLPIGPGAGPEAMMHNVDPVLETLREAFRRYPNEDIAHLIELAEADRGSQFA